MRENRSEKCWRHKQGNKMQNAKLATNKSIANVKEKTSQMTGGGKNKHAWKRYCTRTVKGCSQNKKLWKRHKRKKVSLPFFLN